MKRKTVVLSSEGARIYINHENPDALHGPGKVVLNNPDLKRVDGIPLHLWRVDKGKIYPEKAVERLVRKRLPRVYEAFPRAFWGSLSLSLLAGAAITFACMRYLH